MLAVLYLLPWLIGGCFITRCLLPGHRPLNRLWIGGTLGLLLMMWLPAIFAFAFRFSGWAHLAALGGLALLCGLSLWGRDRREAARWDAEEKRQLWLVLGVTLPFTALFTYLQITHVFLVKSDGSWWVGQSTYGDLPMHAAFVTGLKNASFPPDYPFFPGHRLTYPFLTDSLSTSFYLLGLPLQAAMILPAALMFALMTAGVMILGRELSFCRRAAVLAALLFLLNGGLGFIYDIDMAGGTDEFGRPEILNRLDEIMQGYYKTPTNQPDPNNLRWSNLIADLFVPQRTLLGGYCMVMPCLYLAWTGMGERGREQGGWRQTALLGIWAGALPLVHTHSFLALALCSAGFMGYDLVTGRDRTRILLHYLAYAGLALAAAAPQLIHFTFYQALGGGTDGTGSFLRFQFNWVNNRDGAGMRDLWLWFYVKNIGVPFLIVLMAALEREPRHRRLLCGAAVIWIAAELVRFQPNEYDNNKLFYLAWLLCCYVAADWCGQVFRLLRGMRSRWAIAVVAAVVFFLSPVLTLARECVSGYQAFSAGDVAMAEWIGENTDEDSVFLTGPDNHLNPVDSIAGRTIVCGPDLWLYWHGFDTSRAKADIARFYRDPARNLDVLSEYGVDYVVVSWGYGGEADRYGAEAYRFDALFELVYNDGPRCIYRVSAD